MKRTQRITELVDRAAAPAAAPDDSAATVAAQQKVSGLLRAAYAHEPAEDRLAFFGRRVLAAAQAQAPPGVWARLREAASGWLAVPRLAWAGAGIATLALGLGAWYFAVEAPRRAPVRFESFIIYQTPESNGYVKVFQYVPVHAKDTANKNG